MQRASHEQELEVHYNLIYLLSSLHRTSEHVHAEAAEALSIRSSHDGDVESPEIAKGKTTSIRP